MSERGPRDHAALVFLLALVLFVSPLLGWWSALGLPWWAMFVPWAAVIALAALNAARSDPADDRPARERTDADGSGDRGPTTDGPGSPGA